MPQVKVALEALTLWDLTLTTSGDTGSEQSAGVTEDRVVRAPPQLVSGGSHAVAAES